MIGRFASIALTAMLALVCTAPAAADRKAPADPMAQVCELDWQASFGKIELKQDWSGTGELTREYLSIDRNVPSGDGTNARLWLSGHSMRIEGKDYLSQNIYLGLTAPAGKGKNQRLVIAMPDGEPIVIAADKGGSLVALSDAQLNRMVAAKGRLSYRLIKVDRRGNEKQLLGTGWFDLSGFAGQRLGGLGEAADRARSAMAQARKGDKPPCVMAYAAEANAMDSDEAVRRWLSFDCREGWDGSLGAFELRETGFNWRPRPRDGVAITFAGTFRPAPNAALQLFLLGPNDLQRYGQISVTFGPQDWGANYRTSDPALRERQSGELRRGEYVARRWLSQEGSAGFLWSAFAQLLAGEGDLVMAAHDKVSGASLRSTMPWSEVLSAEEELRAGQRRLTDRERDPMARCRAVVDEELGTEQIIVT